MLKNKQTMLAILFFLLLFGSLLVFFTKVTPLYIFDSDDWYYLSSSRQALPQWGSWNPTRVLPETLMPLCGSFSGFVVFPLLGDYIESFMYVSAFVVSFTTVVYVVSLYILLRRRFCFGRAICCVWALVFLLLHFVALKSGAEGNKHLLWSQSTVTYFYYTIPDLLNSSLVMLFASGLLNEVVDGRGRFVAKGLLVLFAYLALVSNLYSSIILAVWSGTTVLLNLIKTVRQGGRTPKPILDFIRTNIWHLSILVTWGLVQLFEVNGARAGSLAHKESFLSLLVQSTKGLMGDVKAVWVPVLVGTVVLIVIGTILSKQVNDDMAKESLSQIIQSLMAALLMGAYLVLLCTRSYVSHITRPDIFFGCAFFLFLAAFTAFAELLRKFPPITMAAPVLAVVMLFSIPLTTQGFAVTNISGGSCWDAKRVDDDMIRQVVEASESGCSCVDVEVPVYSSGDNWPLTNYGGQAVANALLRHGIIHKPIEVTIVPSDQKSAEFGLGAK